MAILYPTSLTSLVVQVGTRHSHQILFVAIFTLLISFLKEIYMIFHDKSNKLVYFLWQQTSPVELRQFFLMTLIMIQLAFLIITITIMVLHYQRSRIGNKFINTSDLPRPFTGTFVTDLWRMKHRVMIWELWNYTLVWNRVYLDSISKSNCQNQLKYSNTALIYMSGGLINLVINKGERK